MKKNVNFFLLFVIVVIILSLVGLTTYYEKTYKNLSGSYDVKLDEINKLLENLNQERRKLNETTYDLTIQKDREKDLSGQYLEVKGSLDEKQAELDTTKSTLDSTKTSLANKETELAVSQQQVAVLAAEVAAKTSTIKDLQSDLSKRTSERNNAESALAACLAS